MGFKVVLAVCVMIAVASAVQGPLAPLGHLVVVPPLEPALTALAANPLISLHIPQAPWFPQWVPCTMIGTTCLDCNTKMVCTKVGGLQKACSDPTLPHCNLGECSATPSDECAAPAVPASYV